MNKKQQKTLLIWAVLVSASPAQKSKSFLRRFFQKAATFFACLASLCRAPKIWDFVEFIDCEEAAVTRFLGLAFAAPCALLAAGLGSPAARAQDAAYQRYQPTHFVQPGRIGQIDPHQAGGALACPSLGVLASLYDEENLASGGNSNASVASAQIAAAQAGCVILPPATMVQVLSFYRLSATAHDQGSGYLQIQSSTTHGAQWIGAGAVFPLPPGQSGPAPSPFGIAPSAKAPATPLQAAPVPASQSLPQPNNPPSNPLLPEVPQNGAPTMALPPPVPPPGMPTDPNRNGDQPGGYVPLPTSPPASATTPKSPNGACSDIDSLLKATQSGHGCTPP